MRADDGQAAIKKPTKPNANDNGFGNTALAAA